MGDPQSKRLTALVGIGLVNLATITWATNMILGRWLRDEIGPLTLAASRFFIASLLFAILLRRRPPEERRLGPDRRLLLAMAFTGVALFSPVLYLGLRFTTAVNATLISGLGPLITGVMAALLIQESMSRRQLGGAIAGLIGVATLISGGSVTFWRTMGVNVGDLISVVAVTLWALYSVLGRRVMRHRSALSATAFSAFLSLPFLLPAAVWETQVLPMNLGPHLLPFVVYIAIAPTVIGFVSWNEGVRRLGSSGAMIFMNTLPLYGALFGYLLLNEPIGPAHLVGGALIIGGGVWAARAG
ncbi:MAG: DMT family transporter [Anaerolineae bacterium]